MDDITKGLQSALIVVGYYQKWRKGEIEELIYSPKDVSMALDVVIEAAMVLLALEELKSEREPKKKNWVEALKRFPF